MSVQVGDGSKNTSTLQAPNCGGDPRTAALSSVAPAGMGVPKGAWRSASTTAASTSSAWELSSILPAVSTAGGRERGGRIDSGSRERERGRSGRGAEGEGEVGRGAVALRAVLKTGRICSGQLGAAERSARVWLNGRTSIEAGLSPCAQSSDHGDGRLRDATTRQADSQSCERLSILPSYLALCLFRDGVLGVGRRTT